MRTLIAFSAGVVLCPPCHAEEYRPFSSIQQLLAYKDGLVFLTNDYADKSISLCDNGSRWELSKAHPNYDAMASALIATFMAGKQVSLMLEPSPVLLT